MTIIRRIAAPPFAAALGPGSALTSVPALASHDRSVKHQDRHDRADRSSHDKGLVDTAAKADRAHKSGGDKGSNNELAV